MEFKAKKLIVNKIGYVASRKSFLINEGASNPLWVNAGFIRQIFTNLGLSTQTTFQKLLGTTISYQECNVTPEMIAENNGTVIIESPVQKREITFQKPGLKQVDVLVVEYGMTLRNSIDNAGLVFDNSWADRQTTTPANTAQTAKPVQHIPPVEEAEAIEEDVDAEMGAEA